MFTKILNKPKDICINEIHSALSQIDWTDKITRTDNEIKFNWVKPFRGTYSYRNKLHGKILFEGDETTKVTLILDMLKIYIGLGMLLFMGIFLSIMFLSVKNLPTYMAIRLSITGLLIPVGTGAIFTFAMKAYYHRSERDLWFRIASKVDKDVISEIGEDI